MKVLLLGPPCSAIESRITSYGDQVARTEEPVARGDEALVGVDYLVSYGFRHLLKANLLEGFGCRAVNLHISMLPWNRGADPNLWSYLEDTPRGVTIHVLDAGLDTGPILLQKEIADQPEDTLRSSYDRLSRAVVELFVENWPALRTCSIEPVEQSGPFTIHSTRDKERYSHLLKEGWDVPVSELIGKGRG